jgi:UDP-N-acetylglucosamine 2-epimerase (non-hydrolysing)
MKKIIIVLGTRPEAIKLASLIKRLKDLEMFELIVVSTGQHKELLYSALTELDINVDYSLDSMVAGQTLISSFTKILNELENLVKLLDPHLIITVGDTTTTYASALVAFFLNIKLAHVEAGLRTYNVRSPFPEEFFRQSVSLLSDFNFTPTNRSKLNLLESGVNKDRIFTVGNTVIDLLKESLNYSSKSEEINRSDPRIVIVTLHRRENHGTYHENILNAIIRLARRYVDVTFKFPLHLNPQVRNNVVQKLSKYNNIELIEPMGVKDFHQLLLNSYFVITDSGGIQEETTYLGKPTLVTREFTERIEGLEEGPLILAGVNETEIFNQGCKLFDDLTYYYSKSIASKVYGDGNSADLIIDELMNLLPKL